MGELHLTHSSFLSPLLSELHAAGAPVSKYLKRSGLDRFRMDEADCLVPIVSFARLFDVIKKHESINNPVSVFSSAYKLENIGAWGEGVAYCPDVLSACRASQRTGTSYQTNQHVWLEVNGNTSKLNNIYLDVSGEFSKFMEITSLSIMLDGFRVGLGADWVPLEIHTTLTSLDEYDTPLPLNRCKIKYNQSSFGIVFRTNELSTKMKGDDAKSSALLGNLPPEAILISERIERLLDAVDQGPIPNLGFMADYTESSSRSLQRQLAAEGSSYFQVVDDWRFKKSMDLLSDPSLKLNEVAEQLHYANAANFIRAFNRRTGTSPSRFRKSLL